MILHEEIAAFWEKQGYYFWEDSSSGDTYVYAIHETSHLVKPLPIAFEGLDGTISYNMEYMGSILTDLSEEEMLKFLRLKVFW